MKTVYICGDSFAVDDPDSTLVYWVNLLRQSLPEVNIVNLSRICASNLQISLQIDRAIEQGADFVIWLATSSARHDAKFGDINGDLLNQFKDLTASPALGGLSSYSLSYFQNGLNFSSTDRSFLTRYLAEYTCLELDVYHNELLIDAVHARLSRSGIPYIFDQGGFQHRSFGGDDKTYSWPNRSQICLWDHVPPNMPLRPYFHILDPDIHRSVAEYYSCQVQKNL